MSLLFLFLRLLWLPLQLCTYIVNTAKKAKKSKDKDKDSKDSKEKKREKKVGGAGGLLPLTLEHMSVHHV